MFSQPRTVIPKVMPKWFFMAQSQNKTAAGLWRKTHTACAGQVAMCVPAQINIWLTLRSGYYLAEISEREVGGLLHFLKSSSYPLSMAAGAQVSRAVTQHLPDTRKDCDSFSDSLPKCVKGSPLNRWNNQSLQNENQNSVLNKQRQLHELTCGADE